MTRSKTRALIKSYRHDAHKLSGHSHKHAPATYAGVPVNQPVPNGADGDAAALSRPNGQPEQSVENHKTHHRLSLLTGESQRNAVNSSRPNVTNVMKDLLTHSDPQAMHREWLTSEVAGSFNESVFYPYTSLKYHTLLVAALQDNYCEGSRFVDLFLVVDSADEIVPHRTVYAGERFTLRIEGDAGGHPGTWLGSRPCRSWASVWQRLPEHPLDVDSHKQDMILDANLRRIWSWSTALQYIEDFHAEYYLSDKRQNK